MVQEYVSPVRVHKFTFEMVMAAYERRFPNCPQIPVVVECVITEDSWSADNSQRHTTRRCQLSVDAPYLLKKMIGVDYVYFIQKNHLDLKNRVLEIEATNETFSSRVEVLEKCKYFVHPENPDWTCFEQSALLDVKNFFGLESTVEKIAMKQYAANIAKGKELIEAFMKEVHADGIKELRPWSASQPDNNRQLRRTLARGVEPITQAAADPARLSPTGSRLREMIRSHIEPARKVRSRSLDNDIKRDKSSTSDRSRKSIDMDTKSDTKSIHSDRSKRSVKDTATQCKEMKTAYPGGGVNRRASHPFIEKVKNKSKQLIHSTISREKHKDQHTEYKTWQPVSNSKAPPVSSSKAQQEISSQQSKDKDKDYTSQYSRDIADQISRHLEPVTPSPQEHSLQKSRDKVDQIHKELRTESLVSPDQLTPLKITTSVGPSAPLYRSCSCDPVRQAVRVRPILTTWDNLLIVLVCAMAVVIVLSAPLNYVIPRWRDRSDRNH